MDLSPYEIERIGKTYMLIILISTIFQIMSIVCVCILPGYFFPLSDWSDNTWIDNTIGILAFIAGWVMVGFCMECNQTNKILGLQVLLFFSRNKVRHTIKEIEKFPKKVDYVHNIEFTNNYNAKETFYQTIKIICILAYSQRKYATKLFSGYDSRTYLDRFFSEEYVNDIYMKFGHHECRL